MATTTPAPASSAIYPDKFTSAFSVLGGIALVIWAVKTKRKGKFWWFLGGSAIGGVGGYFLDMATAPKAPVSQAAPASSGSAPSAAYPYGAPGTGLTGIV